MAVLYRIKSGENYFEAYSEFTSNTRETERAIRDVKRSKKVSKDGFKQEAWIVATTEHRKKYKSFFKMSAWKDEVVYSDSD